MADCLDVLAQAMSGLCANLCRSRESGNPGTLSPAISACRPARNGGHIEPIPNYRRWDIPLDFLKDQA